MNNNFLLDNENAKVVSKKVVSRSLMKRLISFSGLGLVKGGSGQRRFSIGGRKPEGINP